jgi:hypothetical protein
VTKLDVGLLRRLFLRFAGVVAVPWPFNGTRTRSSLQSVVVIEEAGSPAGLAFTAMLAKVRILEATNDPCPRSRGRELHSERIR